MPDDLDNASSETSDVELLSEGANDETPAEETPEVPEEESESESESSEESEEEKEPSEDEESEETKSEEDDDETKDDKELTRPSWKLITDKYPELAKNKDFREMYHREKAYSELFPTVADAREAVTQARVLEHFDTIVAEGRVADLFSELNESTLKRFSENLLPGLYQVSPQAFARVTYPVLVETLHQVLDRGTRSKDKNLVNAIGHISQALFDKWELPGRPDGNRRSSETDEEVNQLKNEVNELTTQQQRNFMAVTDKSIKKQLTGILTEGLDPKNELSEFTKNALIKQVLDETSKIVGKDEQFKRRMHLLLQQAARSGFSSEFKPRAISAYLGRAKQVALGLRAKYRASAMQRRAAPRENNKNRVEGSGKANGKLPEKNNKSVYREKSDLDIINE